MSAPVQSSTPPQYPVHPMQGQVQSQQPPQGAYLVEDPKTKLDRYVKTYQISPAFVFYLNRLIGKDVVFFLDDSGSMRDPLVKGAPQKKWDELKNISLISMGAATINDEDGIDFRFMNRKLLINGQKAIGMEGVKTEQMLVPLFDALPLPTDLTPLAEGLRALLTHYADKISKLIKASEGSDDCKAKRVRLIIPTDGVPNGGMDALLEVLDLREIDDVMREWISITFIMVTNDASVVQAYRTQLDNNPSYTRIDVVDDYNSEFQKVKKNNPKEPFTFGDYVVKILAGPDVDKLDKLGDSVSNLNLNQ